MPAPDPLSVIEEQLQELQTALAASDPISFEHAARTLRDAAAALAQHSRSAALTPAARARLRATAERLPQLRDQLARVLALTQQQAATLLPPTDAVTYDGKASTAARIYRAPG